MLRNPELIASYWTLAGDVVPLGPPEQEASPHGLTERLKIAANVGYAGIGLMVSDLAKILTQHDFPTIARLLEEFGINYLELEFLVGWIADGEDYRESETTLNFMLEAADNLPVRHLKIGPDMNAHQWPLERMVERFAGLCERAQTVQTAVVLELMPWSNVKDLGLATAIVSGANQNNGGLLLDIWHLARGGIAYSEIRDIPPGLVKHVEINDAANEISGTLLEDTLNNRRFCGDGDFDVVSFLQALDDYGYTGPYGVEILSSIERGRAIELVAAEAYKTAQREFSKL